MLSVAAIKSAGSAKHYFEKDNYYTKDSAEAREASQWFGKGAKVLGLSGQVDSEQFGQLLKGKLPNGEQLGKRQADKILHRPGWDLTFSAPKSVSIMALVGNDSRLITAHNKAVDAALTAIEAYAAQARVFKQGQIQFEDTKNLVIAKFLHDTSRALDPNVHTHAVILNATLRADGKVRSLASQEIHKSIDQSTNGFLERVYARKAYFGTLYDATLAYEVQRLGYSIEKTKHSFEIVGVPQAAIEHFSTRRQQIKTFMEEHDMKGVKAAAAATLMTRDKKQTVDRAYLKELWQVKAKDVAFEPDTLQATLKAQPVLPEQDIKSLAIEALHYTRQHLAEREAVFTGDDIEKTALKHALGTIAPHHIKLAMNVIQQEGHLILTQLEKDGARCWTTPEAVALEKENIVLVKQGEHTVNPIADKIATHLYLGTQALTPGQQDAILLMATTHDRVVGVQGYAGTGKTTMLSAMKVLAEMKGYTLKGIAPSATAANQLGAAGLPHQTVRSFLIESERRLAEQSDKLLEGSHELIVVDESSMLSSREFNEIVKTVNTLDAHVVFLGDIQQLGAVEAGKPSEQAQKAGMATVVMKDILRQQNPALLGAVHNAIRGNIQAALDKIGDRVYEIDDKDKRLQAIANQYLRYTPAERTNVLVLIPSNADRETVNNLIRMGLQNEFTVSLRGSKTTILENRGFTLVEQTRATNYEKNDIIRFNKTYETLGIARGDYVSVKNIDKKNNAINLLKPDGKIVQWQPHNVVGGARGAIEVYQVKEREIASGDIIRWTRNHKQNELYNAEMAEVVSVYKQTADVKIANGKIFTLNLNDKHFQHWDHAYAITDYAAQSKTTGIVIALVESGRKFLTNLKSIYVEISRAQHEAHIVTDNKSKAIRAICRNLGEKSSALEALEKKPLEEKSLAQTKHKNPLQTSKATVYNPPKPIIKPHWNVEAVYQGLISQAEHVIEKLLGEPNRKMSNASRWHYGKKGSLAISMQGDKRGLWHSFETGEGGNLLQLIQREQSVDFKQAVEIAGQLIGLTPENSQSITIRPKAIKPKENIPDAEDQKAFARASQILKRTQPIQGTVAERYLREHRGITHPLNDNFRFHPGIKDPETNRYFPALLVVARDKNGNVQAVQAIMLNPKTAEKAVSIKRTYGRMRFGAFVTVNPGKDKILIAEGPETALSLAQANPEATVLATLSSSNFKNIELKTGKESIVLCADNDGKNPMTNNAIKQAIQHFTEQGRPVYLAKPLELGADFNDIHQQQGIEKVKAIIDQAPLVKVPLITPEIKQPLTEPIDEYNYRIPLSNFKDLALKSEKTIDTIQASYPTLHIDMAQQKPNQKERDI